MAVSQTPAKKTAAKKAAAKAPEPEKGSEVTEPEVVEAEPETTEPETTEADEPDAPAGPTPADGGDGNGDPSAPDNDAAAADAAAGTDPEESGDSGDEVQLDSAQLAAVAASRDHSQGQAQQTANDYVDANYVERESLPSGKEAVAKRAREAQNAELLAGRSTPATVISSVGSDGKKAGVGPNGTLAPIDRSGLGGPTQDDLNPAFAVDTSA